MSLIVGVRFKNNGKTYYFDPGTLSLQVGDGVIVETARGQEYGTVSIANSPVDDKEIASPLKPVLRRATAEDVLRAAENEKLGKEALKVTAQKVEKHKLNMKLVSAEYAFDRSKVTVFFTAEGRVDFRELVRDIAGALHTRIELRQRHSPARLARALRHALLLHNLSQRIRESHGEDGEKSKSLPQSHQGERNVRETHVLPALRERILCRNLQTYAKDWQQGQHRGRKC